jgi:hypothetical protein
LTSAAGTLLLLLAVLAANLPFFTRRILFVIQAKSGEKHLGWRLLEVVLLYFAVGGIARALESRAGEIYPQSWEFYAITFCLFLVLAYPGFVYRYLWQRHK